MTPKASMIVVLLIHFCVSAAAGTPATDPYQAEILPDAIINRSAAGTRPYLWVVAFAIGGSGYSGGDGAGYSVDSNLNISGHPVVLFSNGSHDTINSGQPIAPGQKIQLYSPPKVGWSYEFAQVTPIQTPLGPLPGAIGMVTVLFLQADTPNDAVEQGHALFNQLIIEKIDEFIRNRVIRAKMNGNPALLSAPPTSDETRQLQGDLQAQITDAIKNDLSTWQKIGHFFNDTFAGGTEDRNLGLNVHFWPVPFCATSGKTVFPQSFDVAPVLGAIEVDTYIYCRDLAPPPPPPGWSDKGFPPSGGHGAPGGVNDNTNPATPRPCQSPHGAGCNPIPQ